MSTSLPAKSSQPVALLPGGGLCRVHYLCQSVAVHRLAGSGPGFLGSAHLASGADLYRIRCGEQCAGVFAVRIAAGTYFPHLFRQREAAYCWPCLRRCRYPWRWNICRCICPCATSSNADILSNSGGALGGALLAVSIAQRAWFLRVTRWRIGLFRQGKGVDFGLALVMLWMFAQINPSLPMLGNVFITEPAYRLLVALPEEPFNIWESMAVALNLLMVGALLLTLLRVRRHVVLGLVIMLGLVALTKFVAAALLLKSWALVAVAEQRSDAGYRGRRCC